MNNLCEPEALGHKVQSASIVKTSSMRKGSYLVASISQGGTARREESLALGLYSGVDSHLEESYFNYFKGGVNLVEFDPVEGTISLSLCVYIYVNIIYY